LVCLGQECPDVFVGIQLGNWKPMAVIFFWLEPEPGVVDSSTAVSAMELSRLGWSPGCVPFC
jgi:hypothetical protein